MPDYQLWLAFTDGVEGKVDLAYLVGRGIFARWTDPAEFEKVCIDPTTRTETWPGGVDLDPNVLYERATERAAPTPDATA